MATRTRYTRAFKEQAVNMILQDGLSQIETAERLALSPKTLGHRITPLQRPSPEITGKGTTPQPLKLGYAIDDLPLIDLKTYRGIP
jgi:transposase-like protein